MSVAEQLHQAREARQLTVEQVAEITKIRTDHLRALEAGDFDVFSAPVYIRGFVRSYSTVLKLDVPQVMASLDAELGRTSKFAEPPSLSGPSRTWLDVVMLQFSKIDWRQGLVLLLGLLIVLGVVGSYLAWKHYRTADPLRGVKPAVYQPARPAAGETLPLPPAKR